MSSSFRTAAGFLFAPFVYFAGRLSGSQETAARSIGFDNLFLRGYAARLNAKAIRSDEFSRFYQAARFCALANRSIDAEMHELYPLSHGQLLQDLVCALVHNHKRDGFFVEVGVGDGTKYSNTLMLERDFGWRGILAEPARMFHADIARTRKAVLDDRAVAGETGRTLSFEQDEGMGELSGLASSRTARGQQSISQYDVKTIRFDDLLDELKAPDEIDYISIDTEGSELEILKSLSLRKRRVGLFTIEHNYDARRIAGYRDILGAAGYKPLLEPASGCDSWFVHEDIRNICF